MLEWEKKNQFPRPLSARKVLRSAEVVLMWSHVGLQRWSQNHSTAILKWFLSILLHQQEIDSQEECMLNWPFSLQQCQESFSPCNQRNNFCRVWKAEQKPGLDCHDYSETQRTSFSPSRLVVSNLGLILPAQNSCSVSGQAYSTICLLPPGCHCPFPLSSLCAETIHSPNG